MKISIICIVLLAYCLTAFSSSFLDEFTPAPDTSVWHLGNHNNDLSKAGEGGSGINKAAGSSCNGQRTYIWDKKGTSELPLSQGSVNRGDIDYAMLVWEFPEPVNQVRLYTHQDHWGQSTNNWKYFAQDLMEYSVWGSDDGDAWVLLSDVVEFEANGDPRLTPATYRFSGVEATKVYMKGIETGVDNNGNPVSNNVNGYTREYILPAKYKYIGARTSTISMVYGDADPEIDCVLGKTTTEPPIYAMECPIEENIVVNGDFEDWPNHPALCNRDWCQYSSILGWTAVTDKIEIQNWGHAFTPYDIVFGRAYVELDANRNARIKQTLTTIAGQEYICTFLHGARGSNAADNGVRVYIDGEVKGEWSDVAGHRVFKGRSFVFTAAGSQTDLEFEGSGNSNRLGSYIDGVRVYPLLRKESCCTAAAYSHCPNNVAAIVFDNNSDC